MTPTLLGRWQIRIFLLATIGVIIALLVGLGLGNYQTPLLVLLYVLLFGLVWDILFQVITSYRWDRDWPTSFQVAAGIIEGALVYILLRVNALPGIKVAPSFPIYLLQYGVTWLAIFLLTQGPLRIFWINWRYQGGQWIASRSSQPGQPIPQAQPVPPPQAAGGWGYNPQLPPQPQGVGGNYAPQFAPAVQGIGGNPVQPSVPAPQVIHASHEHHHGQGGLAPAQPYVCACGFASDRSAGSFCPRCGRPKVQQGVS